MTVPRRDAGVRRFVLVGRGLSARVRILGWSAGLLAVALAVSTIATHAVLMHRVATRTAGELGHERAEFERVLSRLPHASAQRVLRVTVRSSVPERTLVLIGIVDRHVVTASGSVKGLQLRRGDALLRRWASTSVPDSAATTAPSGPVTYLAVPFRVAGGSGHAVFVAAVLTGSDRAEVWHLTQISVVVQSIALAIAIAVSWLLAGRVLRPVRQTTELARRITETDLAERLPVRGNDEITSLTVTINEMLDRLQSALSTQRAFLADAGHELRTPITIVQGNLETMRLSDPDDIESAAIALDELQRMSRMVDDLLTLARSERPDFLRLADTDVAQLSADLAAKLEQLDPGRWRVTCDVSGSCALDRQRVSQAVLELAANARTYSPTASPLGLTVAVVDGTLDIRVTDHGPGIPVESRRRIFARFARLDGRRPTGTGLGLSIVDAICRAHGGTVTVHNAEPPPGAEFRIRIPCRAVATAPADLLHAGRTP